MNILFIPGINETGGLLVVKVYMGDRNHLSNDILPRQLFKFVYHCMLYNVVATSKIK